MNARMGKPEYPGGGDISQMQCKPYDINLDEGFTATKTQKNKKERRERNSHIHSHTIIHVYIYIYVLMQYGSVVLLKVNVLGCWLTY